MVAVRDTHLHDEPLLHAEALLFKLGPFILLWGGGRISYTKKLKSHDSTRHTLTQNTSLQGWALRTVVSIRCLRTARKE